MLTIEVRSQVFGVKDSPELLPVFLNLLEEHLTVAELIRRSVEEQVRELVVKCHMDSQQVRRTLERHYLTAAEIADQAEQGTVRYPSNCAAKVPQINPKAEVQKALRAFEAGRYVILVNGQQVEHLDEELIFNPNTKVTFLRLMPLVGG